ncbi:glycosyltransferase family 2 protein [Cyanobium sp. HWJ4-Hawea]|uniref:glycosyltransferase family A protein n=1 Tax=Cyanobium sp. HWJ4-Hawea TaxID=2823713 RepID=UPI0020CCC584|nr:glycosyltransferase family A protein [Cyanobium sp. HWJ4-Hawea]MCP9808676.1 glycosyltransferase family 2 protein [Cyanobium sp. HWJ4-Hawea]
MSKHPFSAHILNTEILRNAPKSYAEYLSFGVNVATPQKKLLTLGIPSYNRPYRLRRVLRALKFALGSKSDQWFSIIVSINGSSKGYLPVVREFADLPVFFYKNLTGTNFGSNLQNLANLCSTKYMVFQGDDDWLPPLNLFYLSSILLNEPNIDIGTLKSQFISHQESIATHFFSINKDIFSIQSLFGSHSQAALIHQLFEPICGLFIRVDKFREINLDPPARKLIFPQHCWVSHADLTSLAIVSIPVSIASIANAFEEFCDKESEGCGILTHTYGLPERIINRLSIVYNQYAQLPSFFAIFYLYYLWQSEALITQEFFRDDSRNVAKVLDFDPYQLRTVVAELLQMPILFCIPSVFIAIHQNSDNIYIEYCMFCMGVHAFFIKLIGRYGCSWQRTAVLELIRSFALAASWHPSLSRLSLRHNF